MNEFHIHEVSSVIVPILRNQFDACYHQIADLRDFFIDLHPDWIST